MEIVSPNSVFDFNTLSLADPQPLSGSAGFYFTQLGVGSENKSLFLQLPECVTKQGIVNVKNAKYLDLMFERDKHDELMKWVEKLEYTCQDIIDSKKELWFQTELTRDDIETMMTQVTRLYQSGKYILMRVFVDINKNGQKCIAYDENEIEFDLDILESNKTIIPLVMIEGVKFSSRSFEISLKLVQVMLMEKFEKKNNCLIKRQDIVSVLDKPVSVPVSAAPAMIAPVTPAPVKQALAPVKQTPVKQAPVTLAPAPVKQAPVTLAPAPVKQSPVTLAPAPVTLAPTIVKNNPIHTTKIATIGENQFRPNRHNTTVGNTTVGMNKLPINLEKKELEEVNIHYNDVADSISLKNPNEVYYEMYRKAREKAKLCRIKALEAYLEVKQIKTKYMLHELEDSEEEESDAENDNLDFD